MFVHVWATSATAGHAYLQNLNVNQSVTINFAAPAGTKLIGEAAEWVLERPTVGSALATLPNFGGEYFVGAVAKTVIGRVALPATPSSTAITMVSGSTPIATPSLTGVEAVLFTNP
jgi:hypothetical protein